MRSIHFWLISTDQNDVMWLQVGMGQSGTNTSPNMFVHPDPNHPMANTKVSGCIVIQSSCNYIVFRRYRNRNDSLRATCSNINRHPDWRSIPSSPFRWSAVPP